MDKRRYPSVAAATVLAAVITLYLHSLLAFPTDLPAAKVVADLSPSRYLENVRYLASDDLKGRGDGLPELDKAAEYIASQFRLWGLRPMGDNHTYFQKFEITTGAEIGPKTTFQLNGNNLRNNDDFVTIPFSTTADFEGPIVFAGFGITAP